MPTLPHAAQIKSRRAAYSFRLRRGLHQGVRLLEWALHPQRFGAPQHAPGALPYTGTRISVPLARTDADAHPLLEAGKQHNVALAARSVDGLTLAPGAPFSFWRAVGRLTAGRGYRHGMALHEGCVVPTVGGGVCLLSNALFQLAAQSGWRILERHGHSIEAVPHTGPGPWGMDATLSWPDVDLRFAPEQGTVRLHVAVDATHLHVWASSSRPFPSVLLWAEDDRLTAEDIRENLVLRRVGERTEVLAANRKRLTGAAQRRRNCLTCGEQARCHLMPDEVRAHLSGTAPLP